MHMFHHKEYLCDQEACILCSKWYYFGDHIEEILSLYELHDEVDEVAVFDEFVETYNELVSGDCSKDFLLVHDVLDYLGFLDVEAV